MEKTSPRYWLTRFMILRLLGLVYATGFLIIVNQWVPLLGEKGLTPVPLFLARVQASLGSLSECFLRMPTLFWFAHSDSFALTLGWVGLALSVVVMLGYANGLMMTVLWALYMSFVHVGQDWYSFGWEIQLLETGFLAIFLVPFFDGRPFPKFQPPTAVIWLYRWLAFRIMLGAGLIKWRGDECWRDLTCLCYHYETQPVPNFFSPYFHFMPLWFEKLSVLFNHWVELVCPWFILVPGWGLLVAGLSMTVFQVILILSGNLAFLNWLTLVPVLACFKDSNWRRVLPGFLTRAAEGAEGKKKHSPMSLFVVGGLVLLVVCLSFDPVKNLLSSEQAMNTSFNCLDLVNTYGAFGSVGKERLQLVIEGTMDKIPGPKAEWKEYGFKVQPGDLYRRPPWISPYHYRLDWLAWFAAMASPAQYPWMFHLVWQLLHNNPGALSLIGSNPFPNAPPRYIRVHLYRYHFAPLNHPNGQWWTRDDLGLWMPPLSADQPGFRQAMREYGWE